jgi:hypothetical protein
VTVLVAAHTTLDVPVSCVAHGRWHCTARDSDRARNDPTTARTSRPLTVGGMPEVSRFLGIVIKMYLHQAELLANWERAARSQPLLPIEPLE